MTEGAISLAAAANVASLSVRIQPRIGVLANGDELAAPGSKLAPGEVVNSIQPALLALIRRWGAIALDLGVAKDDEADVRRRLNVPCDIVVSIGGASVGDYDVVRSAFAADGFAPVFEKVAVKPGKPTWFSKTDERLALGLPGNPAAAMVTAQIFLRPLIEAMTAAAAEPEHNSRAVTADRLPGAGNRQEYLRAVLSVTPAGIALVKPAENQDSSLLSPFLTANALIRRPANAPSVAAGALVEIVMLK
jgi:molybdopterin molybdotransferase